MGACQVSLRFFHLKPRGVRQHLTNGRHAVGNRLRPLRSVIAATMTSEDTQRAEGDLTLMDAAEAFVVTAVPFKDFFVWCCAEVLDLTLRGCESVLVVAEA
jgi:hypothetical protein